MSQWSLLARIIHKSANSARADRLLFNPSPRKWLSLPSYKLLLKHFSLNRHSCYGSCTSQTQGFSKNNFRLEKPVPQANLNKPHLRLKSLEEAITQLILGTLCWTRLLQNTTPAFSGLLYTKPNTRLGLRATLTKGIKFVLFVITTVTHPLQQYCFSLVGILLVNLTDNK